MRYYYHKKVLTKIRGRKYTYKFDIRELERQYGYKEAPSPREWSGNSRREMPATCYCLCHPITGQHFPAFPSLMAIWLQQEELRVPSSQYAHWDKWCLIDTNLTPSGLKGMDLKFSACASCYVATPFSSPEAAILLVSTKNRDLWPVPIFEHAQKTLSIVFSQSDLSDLTISTWIADFRCWERQKA